MTVCRKTKKLGSKATWEKLLLGVLDPTGNPVVFTRYQQDDRSQSWCKKRLDRIGHTHSDCEPFRVFVDPDNLKSVV